MPKNPVRKVGGRQFVDTTAKRLTAPFCSPETSEEQAGQERSVRDGRMPPWPGRPVDLLGPAPLEHRVLEVLAPHRDHGLRHVPARASREDRAHAATRSHPRAVPNR
ncbi:hypothetical protein AB0D09_23245 [Streptomyces sp. NPDC049097]|uniref:hypothetical protein n=1 Tax=Streptomyces sp. NPDC049097 TaxID=3155497 RepID=UPI00341692A1